MKKTLYFKNDGEFEQYYAPVNGVVPSGDIAIIGDYEKIYTSTNNLDKSFKEYEVGGTSVSGTISITENGNGIDVSSYATANVNVAGSTPSITWVNSTTAGTWGEMVTPATAITAEVTVGKTYRIHFDGTYSSETRYLYIWGHGSDYDVEGMYGYIDPSVNNFDFTILPFIYSSSEGGSTELASDFELHIAIVDGAPETEQGATYAFRYAELPAYPAGGPTT